MKDFPTSKEILEDKFRTFPGIDKITIIIKLRKIKIALKKLFKWNN
jgi:hypothetical protein